MSDTPSIDEINRRNVLKYAGAATSAIGLAGCSDDGGDAESGNGNGESDGNGDGLSTQSLYFSQVKGPLDMDPIVINDVPSEQIASQIFDGIYEYDLGLTPQPKIAADMPEIENDGTRYIIPIREEAEFWNGDPVTAEDVIHTIRAPFEEETDNAADVDMVESAEVIDEKTAQFDLQYPYGAFTTTLTRNVVSAEVRTADREGYNAEPVGSGPFKLVDWEEEDFATLERWDDYWDADRVGLPNVETIEFDPIEEQTTRVTSLETGDTDIIETIPPQMYGTVENMDDASIDEEPGVGYFYLEFNCNEGPTADPLVREAVDYSFSMDQAIENFVEPAGVRQASPFQKTMAEEWDFPIDEWAEIEHDRDFDQAKQLFEEAGVNWDYDWRIIVPPDDMREQIGISIGDGLQAVGFENVEVQRLDWGTFLDNYNTGNEDDYNMFTLGWSGGPDPDDLAYHMFSQEVEGVTNGSFHDYDEASEKITRARESADRDERRELYTDAMTTLLENRVQIPAYNLNNSFGVRDYVEDFQAHPISPSIQIFTDDNNVSVNR